MNGHKSYQTTYPKKVVVGATLSCYPDRGPLGTINVGFSEETAKRLVLRTGLKFRPAARKSSKVLFALERSWHPWETDAVPLQPKGACFEVYSTDRPLIQGLVKRLGRQTTSVFVTIKDGLLLVHVPGHLPSEGDDA